MLSEEQEANKKLNKNVKFNRAFDVAKVAAEYLSKYSTQEFTKNLDSFKQFTELLRTGLPEDVKEILQKHCTPEETSLNAYVRKKIPSYLSFI